MGVCGWGGGGAFLRACVRACVCVCVCVCVCAAHAPTLLEHADIYRL